MAQREMLGWLYLNHMGQLFKKYKFQTLHIEPESLEETPRKLWKSLFKKKCPQMSLMIDGVCEAMV